MSRNTILCFDFDGVICDSVDELSISGYKYIATLLSALFDVDDSKHCSSLLPYLRLVRPVLETGYEIIYFILYVQEKLDLNQTDVKEFESVFSHCDWSNTKSALVAKYNLPDRETLIKGFGNARDKWMREDYQSWISENKAYVGACEYVRKLDKDNIYIITTKQRRFTQNILESWDLAEYIKNDNIYTLEDGPKTSVLANILKHKGERVERIAFIEDKLETLEKVSHDWRLKDKIGLVLVDWGYNTKLKQDMARELGFQVISQLSELKIDEG